MLRLSRISDLCADVCIVMAEMLSARTAADLLGVDKRTILRMVRNGKIRSFRTPGGQHRFRRTDIETLAAGRETTPTHPASIVDNKRDEVETLNLEMQARRAKRELARMEAEYAAEEQRAAEARRTEALAHKRALSEMWMQREREREERKETRAREVAERQRRIWESEAIAAALASVPRDVPSEVRTAAAESLREALGSLEPDDSPKLISTTTTLAIARALAPWDRVKEIQRTIQEAENLLPWQTRAVTCPTDTQLRFRAAADAAIRGLPPDAAISQVRIAAQTEARKLADEFERQEAEKAHRRNCAALIESVHWRVLETDRAAAQKATNQALAQLPIGCSSNEPRDATGRAIAPFKKRKEMAERAERFLEHVAVYIDKIGAPDGEWDLGDYFERRKLAERLTKEIRPELMKALFAGEIEDEQDAVDFIGRSIDFGLEEDE